MSILMLSLPVLMPAYRPFALVGPAIGQPDWQPSGFGHNLPCLLQLLCKESAEFPLFTHLFKGDSHFLQKNSFTLCRLFPFFSTKI
jgi:hypothetical protein